MSAPSRQPRASTRSARGVWLGVLLVAAAGIFWCFIALGTFQTFSPAMEPTLAVGDRFVVAPGAVHAGDVVVIELPSDGVDDVKRVIGVAGDRIEIRDDVVYVNGASIRIGVGSPCDVAETTDDPADCETFEERIGSRTWRTSHSTLSQPESMTQQTVPPDTVFVLGDHRDRSNDSRNPRIGMVPLTRVRRATVIYWSEHAGRIGRRVE